MNSPGFPILTLASARSGTSFLADFFQRNVLDCYSTHEPYLTPGNPVLFGKAIEWNSAGRDDKLLPLLEKKCAFIRAHQQPFYFEANHAIAKAFDRHLPTLLPEARFIHLVRNPAAVAKSELLREQVIRRFPIPFVDYRSERGEQLFRWSLTGQERIFQDFTANHPQHRLSRFGFYLLQWFEVEYRIRQVLQCYSNPKRVFYLNMDTDVREESVLREMLNHFGLRYKEPLAMNLHRNKTWFVGPSTLTKEEDAEQCFIVQNLPEVYRELVE